MLPVVVWGVAAACVARARQRSRRARQLRAEFMENGYVHNGSICPLNANQTVQHEANKKPVTSKASGKHSTARSFRDKCLASPTFVVSTTR